MPQFERIGGADINRLLVRVADVGPAHNMRNQRKYNFLLVVIARVGSEEIFQEWNLRQQGHATKGLGLAVFEQPAQQVDFAFLQADFMFDLALPDDGLADAADVGCPVTEEISRLTFSVTSRLACTRGVMSMFTPTSRY